MTPHYNIRGYQFKNQNDVKIEECRGNYRL